MTITEELFKLQDKDYALFQSKLIPTVPRDSIIGIRVPELRKIAKRVEGSLEAHEFIKTLPHKYFDENMLHELLISGIKDYAECIRELDKWVHNKTIQKACESYRITIEQKAYLRGLKR